MRLLYYYSGMIRLHAPRYDSSKEMITPEDTINANSRWLDKQKNKRKPEILADIIRWIYAPCRICNSTRHQTENCPYPWGWHKSLAKRRTIRELLEPYRIIDPVKKPSVPYVYDDRFYPVPSRLTFKHRNKETGIHNLGEHFYSCGRFEQLKGLKIAALSYPTESYTTGSGRFSWFKWWRKEGRRISKQKKEQKQKKQRKKIKHNSRPFGPHKKLEFAIAASNKFSVEPRIQPNETCWDFRPYLNYSSYSRPISFRSLIACFVSVLFLLFFASLGLPSCVMSMFSRYRRKLFIHFHRKRRLAYHKKIVKEQAEFLAFIAILQSMRGGSTPGRKGFQKGRSGRISVSSQGSDTRSNISSSQQLTTSDRRRSQPTRGEAGLERIRAVSSQRFSLPTVLDSQESKDPDSLNDQYEAATIDASSYISERKRRRWGKRKRGSARPAGPGRGHKKINDPTPLELMTQENSIRDELESDLEDEDQEPIPRRPPSSRIAAIQEQERQQRERNNYVRVPAPEPVTARCWQKHRGLGCAAKDANHIPQYYDSLIPNPTWDNQEVYVACQCPFCKAKLLPAQLHDILANGKKCPHCANGKVDLRKKMEELKQPFRELPFVRLVDSDKRLAKNVVEMSERFLSKAYNYNLEFSFGSAITQKETVPRRFHVVKYNEVVSYNASGINPPVDKPESFAQIHTLRPEDVHLGQRVMRNPLYRDGQNQPPVTSDDPTEQRIIDRQVDHRIHRVTVPVEKVLDEAIVRQLTEYFAANNWLSGVYYHAKEIYDMKVQECAASGEKVPDFRLLLLNQRKVREKGIDVEQEIHPHRLQQPMEREREFNESSNYGLMAQIYFCDASAEPPSKEIGILIEGRTAFTRQIDYSDPLVDAICFPLLFSRCQTGYERGTPLVRPDQEEHDRIEIFGDSQRSVPAYGSDVGDHPEDDEELGEEGEGIRENDDDPVDSEEEDLVEPEVARKIAAEERRFVSRNQWIRYMTKITGKTWKETGHWIWWGRDLAQHYILSYWNRVQTEKVLHIKHHQQDLRSCLPQTLIEAYQRKLEAWAKNKNLPHPPKLGMVYHAPITYRGSRRYYQKKYADAMTIVREMGVMHLFITFTTNEKAPEFKHLLFDGQVCCDRPDCACRLFIDKKRQFMEDLGLLKKRGREEYVNEEGFTTAETHAIFGPVKGWFYSMEHQKGGTPHAHFCIILDWPRIKEMWKTYGRGEITYEAYIDQYITAEIPSSPDDRDHSLHAVRQREYHDFVVNHMYHTCSVGVTGCKETAEDKCSKGFPKDWSDEIRYAPNRTTIYRRRRPPQENEVFDPAIHGHTYIKPARVNMREQLCDNRFVIPHNKFLICKYGAHINVEWCYGDQVAKYITKYAMKGTDMCFVGLTRNNQPVYDYDEFMQIALARYMTSQEAMMGILSEPLTRLSEKVLAFYVHKENSGPVLYEEGDEEAEAARLIRLQKKRKPFRRTPFTEYMELNKRIGSKAENYTYATISDDYFWHKPSRTWRERTKPSRHLVRIGHVSPSNTELHALRVLAFHVRGPKSFKDYKTYKGVVYETFFEAAVAQEFLFDNTMWRNTISAAMNEIGTMRQRLYWLAIFLATNRPENAHTLVEEFLSFVSPPNLTPENMLLYFLLRLEFILRRRGYVPSDAVRADGTRETAGEMLGLPHIDFPAMTPENHIMATYFPDRFEQQILQGANFVLDLSSEGPSGGLASLTEDEYKKHFDENIDKANTEQKDFVAMIVNAAKIRAQERLKHIRYPDMKLKRLHFLTGEGGVGKTFVYNLLIAYAKFNSLNVMPCASTGIAATLLFDGTTAHRRFIIPKNVRDDTQVRHVTLGQSEILMAGDLIILDEVTALNQNVFDYIDRMLRHVEQNATMKELPFAGKIVIVGGDWKQTAPVVTSKNFRVYDDNNMHNAQFNGSIKNHKYFNGNDIYQFETTRLTINNRIEPNQESFKDYLRMIGAGIKTLNFKERVFVPKSLQLTSIQALAEFVFPPAAIKDPLNNLNELKEAAILTPLNEEAIKINDILLRKMMGNPRVYQSIDQAHAERPEDLLAINAADSNIENIYKKTPQGLPPHDLKLKEGSIMTIIRNLSVESGLCNGTRVQITKLYPSNNIIKCRHINGPRGEKGEEFILGRFRFEFGGEEAAINGGGVQWTRVQFPLRPGLVLTINKAQGQTLSRVGLALDSTQCFAHGQLYVGCSRVRSAQSLRVLMRSDTDGKITNCVQRRLLDQYDTDQGSASLQRLEAGAFNTIAVSTPDTPLEFQTPIIVESLPMEWLDQPMTPPASQTSFQSGISGIRLQDSTPPSQGFTPPRGKRSRRERSGTPCSRRVSDIRNTNQSEPPSTTHQPPSFRTTMQNVQGDGNCFFRAIAFILRGWESDQDHRLLRRLAMDEWLGMDFVGYPVTNILDFDSNIGHHDLQSYTATKRRPARGGWDVERWGCALDAFPLARVLHRTIVVVAQDPGNNNEYAHIFREEGVVAMRQRVLNNDYSQFWQTEEDPIVIWYNGVGHYQAIVPPNNVPSWGNARVGKLSDLYMAETANRRANPPDFIYARWPALPGHLGND